jgi:CHAT domain-containing protein/Tfp pilus assembly protein PilF
MLSYGINGTAQTSNYNDWKTSYDKGLEFVEKDSLKIALPILQKAYDIAQKLFKNTEEEYINSLTKLATVYNNTGKASQALPLYLESIEISKLKKLDKGLAYAETLKTLHSVYIRLRNYNEAVKAVEYSNQVIKEFYGENDLNYIKDLSRLTIIYADVSEYSKGLENQRKALKYFEGKDKISEDYGFACFSMSYLYGDINEYEKEIEFMKKVIAIYGEDHPASSTFNNNIGLSYQNLGNQEQALSYFLIALKKSKNKESEGYATRLENLAFSYVSLGEFEKAENIYDEALNIWNKHLNINHKNYGRLLNNVGKLYRKTGNYKKAKQLFKVALDNFLQNFDKNHSRYGYMLNDYASMLLELDQEDEAIELMKDNLQIAIDNNIIDTEDFYGRQHNLAKAYNRNEQYIEAKPLLESAVENIPRILGKEHPKYGEMLKSLSDTYIGLGEVENAVSIIKLSNDILINQIDQIFKFRSEKEKHSFLKMLSKNFNDLQSLPFLDENKFEDLNAINLNNQLMLKGLLLNNSKNILVQLTTLNDYEIEDKIINYKTSKRLLTKVLTQAISEREIDIDSLKNTINLKEADLVKIYSTKFENNLSLIKNWKQSQSALSKNDVAIEFSHFNLTNKGKKTDSIMYVAYIYDAISEKPKLIPLFEERQLKQLLANNKSPNELYQSQELCGLIWKPISKYISKNANVYYSPSGLLDQISFSAIPTHDDVLINAFNLVQLSSTDVLVNKVNEPDISNTLFVGGINYEYSVDSAEEEIIADSETYNYLESTSFSNSRGTKSRGESWTYLPGTLTEIENLKSKFEATGNSVNILSNNEATEANFKKLSGDSPQILHIATHGFFFENLNKDAQFETNLSTEDQYRLAEDPLLRSGLILAGANYFWKNGNKPSNEVEDGILTAMEISNLDLSNTNMVVLSACETGLGDIDGSEGVYGLQRAFKMAGVDIIVMSLWQVPDAETAEFMNAFYEHWLEGQNVKLAFNNAQRMMHKKYKEEPLKWAAFVLFE